MSNKTCPSCEQVIPQKRLEYLTNIHKAIVDYYSDLVPDCDQSAIEVTIRIDGKVVEFIHPEAFDLIDEL